MIILIQGNPKALKRLADCQINSMEGESFIGGQYSDYNDPIELEAERIAIDILNQIKDKEIICPIQKLVSKD